MDHFLTLSLMTRELIHLVEGELGMDLFSYGTQGAYFEVNSPAPRGFHFHQRHVLWGWDEDTTKLSLDDFSERILHPIAATLAQNMRDGGVVAIAPLRLPNKGEVAQYCYRGISMRGWRLIEGFVRWDVLFLSPASRELRVKKVA